MSASQALARTRDVLTMPRRKRRHPWLWVTNVLVVIVVIMLASAAITTPGFEWDRVAGYLFEVRVLQGVVMSITMTIITMALAIFFGVVVALMRMSASKALSGIALAYIWVFRSIPMLVLLLFFYNIAALFPQLSIGIPWGHQFVSVSTNDVISPLSAAIIGLTLHQTAYVAELVRSGLLAVSHGQREAASALGLNSVQSFFRIVMPQAMRIIIPPLGNEVISLLKATSLVSVISLTDLLYSVQLIYAKNYETIPLLIVASIWYMIIVGVLTLGQQRLENHFGRRTLSRAATTTSGES